ncbi:MAG: M23 family metallopeptidase [Sulfurimonadaceae bacterium]
MDHKINITIEDAKGVKEFTFHKRVKHFALYTAASVVVLLILSVYVVFQLTKELGNIEAKKSLLEAQNTLLEQTIKNKERELTQLDERLDSIEELIGMDVSEDAPLSERVDVAQLTSKERSLIFEIIPNGSPIEYHGVTSKFGYRTHPITGRRELHQGSDMKAKLFTEVYATANGVVEYAGYHRKSGFGRLIILNNSYGFRTYFAHLGKIDVKHGQVVQKGDLIGLSGNSGRSNGPHLHYEIRFMHRAVNPFWFIKWTMSNYEEIFKKEKHIPWEPLLGLIAGWIDGGLPAESEENNNSVVTQEINATKI